MTDKHTKKSTWFTILMMNCLRNFHPRMKVMNMSAKKQVAIARFHKCIIGSDTLAFTILMS